MVNPVSPASGASLTPHNPQVSTAAVPVVMQLMTAYQQGKPLQIERQFRPIGDVDDIHSTEWITNLLGVQLTASPQPVKSGEIGGQVITNVPTRPPEMSVAKEVPQLKPRTFWDVATGVGTQLIDAAIIGVDSMVTYSTEAYTAVTTFVSSQVQQCHKIVASGVRNYAEATLDEFTPDKFFEDKSLQELIHHLLNEGLRDAKKFALLKKLFPNEKIVRLFSQNMERVNNSESKKVILSSFIEHGIVPLLEVMNSQLEGDRLVEKLTSGMHRNREDYLQAASKRIGSNISKLIEKRPKVKKRKKDSSSIENKKEKISSIISKRAAKLSSFIREKLQKSPRKLVEKVMVHLTRKAVKHSDKLGTQKLFSDLFGIKGGITPEAISGVETVFKWGGLMERIQDNSEVVTTFLIDSIVDSVTSEVEWTKRSGTSRPEIEPGFREAMDYLEHSVDRLNRDNQGFQQHIIMAFVNRAITHAGMGDNWDVFTQPVSKLGNRWMEWLTYHGKME